SELQESMFDLALLVRSETGLKKMQQILGGLRERYERVFVQDTGRTYNTELMEAVELGFLLDCAEATVAAALAREETRGAHYREDHPLRDDEHWLKHSLAYRGPDGSVRLDFTDGTLALRRSCAHGICGSDAMMINGKNRLACKVLVKDVLPKATVEPIRGLPVLKDLIVDMEPFFAGYRSILPYLINDEGEPDRE